MAGNHKRPLSPHLSIWRWGPAMTVSILHRAAGDGMATVGAAAFVWWLVAAASGPDAYAVFLGFAKSWFGILVAVGLTWAFFQHLASGIRHFVLDTGAGYELNTNKTGSIMTIIVALTLTIAVWAFIFSRTI